MTITEIKKIRKEAFTGSNIVNDWQYKAYESGLEDAIRYGLPDIEKVSAFVHDAWFLSKKIQGVNSRKSEDGEELMVPYPELSEKAKDLDRATVKAVYKAIEEAAMIDNLKSIKLTEEPPISRRYGG